MLLHCSSARRISISPNPQIPIAAAVDPIKKQQSLAHSSAAAPFYQSTHNHKLTKLTPGSVNTVRYYIHKNLFSISTTRSSERESPSPILMSGRGRGNRGEYYKNKYGRGNAGRFGGGRQGQQSPDDVASSPSYRADQLRSHGGAEDLRDSLRRLEGWSLHAIHIKITVLEKSGPFRSCFCCRPELPTIP